MTSSIGEVWDLNAAFVETFIAEKMERRRYRREHPTEVAIAACMDGRLNFRSLTRVIGSMTEYRNLGGIFDHGWPAFDLVLREWVQHAEEKRRYNLLLACYHYSAGDPQLGCRGHGFDRERAVLAAQRFARQTARVWGRGQVFPVLVGIETDEDNLIVHPSGHGRELLSVGYESVPGRNGTSDATVAHFRERLRELHPDMPDAVLDDLVQYVVGNYRHVRDVRGQRRSHGEMNHAEWLVGLGQGIHPWLTRPNVGIIVSGFNPNLVRPIVKALTIIAGNLADGRTARDPVLLVCEPYRDEGPNLQRAIERVVEMRRVAVEDALPQVDAAVRKRLSVITAVMDVHTRRIAPVDIDTRSMIRGATPRISEPPLMGLVS